MLDKTDIHARLEAPVLKDYGVYLAVDRLLACQKPLADLVTPDELQFQIVHQVEELWMKLAAFTLAEIDQHLREGRIMRAITLFGRVHMLLRMMTDQLALIETMSPYDYQAIRLQLGNGSGQESPGFQMLLTLPAGLWDTYRAKYLDPQARTLTDIYDTGYAHDDAYMVAEALIEFDELFQKFRAHHIYLVHRSIGMGSKAISGRAVDLLDAGARHRFFPELWAIRAQMTDRWGAEYGVKRDSIRHGDAGHGSGV